MVETHQMDILLGVIIGKVIKGRTMNKKDTLVLIGIVIGSSLLTYSAYKQEEQAIAAQVPLRTQIINLNDQLHNLDKENTSYRFILETILGEVPNTSYSTPVTVTAYTASEDETNNEPWFTADMSLSRVGMLAVSRDLLRDLNLKLGDEVVLGGYGVFKIRDKMNKRFTRRVDILFAHKKAALLFGKEENVKMTWFR